MCFRCSTIRCRPNRLARIPNSTRTPRNSLKPGETPDTDSIKVRDCWLSPPAYTMLSLLGYGTKSL
jgi:hypothetical protein